MHMRHMYIMLSIIITALNAFITPAPFLQKWNKNIICEDGSIVNRNREISFLQIIAA